MRMLNRHHHLLTITSVAYLLAACGVANAAGSGLAAADGTINYQGHVLVYADQDRNCRFAPLPTSRSAAPASVLADGSAELTIYPGGRKFSYSSTTDMELTVFGALDANGTGSGRNYGDGLLVIVTPISDETSQNGLTVKRYTAEVHSSGGSCLYGAILYSGDDASPN